MLISSGILECLELLSRVLGSSHCSKFINLKPCCSPRVGEVSLDITFIFLTVSNCLFQFFSTKPLPCDPLSLPKYPPSKEFDAKIRDEEARRYLLYYKIYQDLAFISLGCGIVSSYLPH